MAEATMSGSAEGHDPVGPTRPAEGAVSRHRAPHYRWGDVCDGWRLLDDPGLSVIEERVPAGAGEQWHVHDSARQFFYILAGRAELQMRSGSEELAAGDGITVVPGLAHRFVNPGPDDVRFLVVSAPNSSGDRRGVDPPSSR